jgi:hypothetical protein
VDALYNIADAIVRFMDSSPAFPIGLLYLAVAAVPVTLVHELGHAFAARRLIDGDVQVSVGSAGKLAEIQLGKVALAVNALSHPGRAAGVAEFDASRATARDVLLIALAGPAASLAGAVLTAWALSAASPSGVLHDLLWLQRSAECSACSTSCRSAFTSDVTVRWCGPTAAWHSTRCGSLARCDSRRTRLPETRTPRASRSSAWMRRHP